MERLCAIAGLPMDERVEVARAYLATPTLVGREKALLAVRRRMLSLVRGDGGTLLHRRRAGHGPLAPARRVRARGQAARRDRAARRRRATPPRATTAWRARSARQLFELLPAEAARGRAARRAACSPTCSTGCATAARRPRELGSPGAQPAAARAARLRAVDGARPAAADRGRRRRPHRRALGGAARRARAQGREAQP